MKRIFPHLFVFLTFCLCMYLGIWQLQRMEWKNSILDRIENNMQTIILPKEYQNIEEDEFKQMKIVGRFLHDEEFHILSRTYNGKAGTHVVTPLLTESGDKILVNRGWVKADGDYEKPTDTIEVTGVIRVSQKGGWLALENDPENNHWFSIDLPVMYEKINQDPKGFYIDRVSDDKTYPLSLPKEIKLHNSHLQYVITWFSLSFALLVIYYFRFWKRK